MNVTQHIKRLKEKNDITVSMKVENAFNVIWHAFKSQTHSKLGLKGNFHFLGKGMFRSCHQVLHSVVKC